jgi:mono/diheme cytochrome c family protein
MKWFKRVLLGAAGLALLVIAAFYASSEYIIKQHYTAEPRALNLADVETLPGEGERLARVFGCYRGCHGQHMEGSVAFEDPAFLRAVAPSLKDAVRTYDMQQLEALVRQGVRPDGRSVWAMPSGSFASMTDRHLAEILGFIRDYPEHERAADLPDFKFYAGGRLAVLTGLMEAQAAIATRFKPLESDHLSDPMVQGRYFALNACSECHNTTLDGFEGFTPSLAVARGYSREQFRRLMSEGIGVGDRQLGLMSEVAKMRFSHFNAAEVDALYDYLQSR